MSKNTAILLMHCPDQTGLVAAVTDFLHKNNGNIIDLDQHVDTNEHYFFMRVEWNLEGFAIPKEKIDDFFSTLVGKKYDMKWQLHFTEQPQRMAIFVSKMSHCFYDILQRCMSKEWNVEIAMVISNHPNLEPIAHRFDLPFHVIPITKETKREQEEKELALLKEANVDFVVLARYMQIISDNFIRHYENKIINIHHSFLPSFKGAKPYHRAYERGVKLIGATAHYVTADLDEGPIIEQGIQRVDHTKTPAKLIDIGRDVEAQTLAEAVRLHTEHRAFLNGSKTVILP